MLFTVQQKVRGGRTPWPPRSPHLTPIDFFYWGYIQDIVYSTTVVDLEDLRRRIVAACATVVLQEVAIRNFGSSSVIYCKLNFHSSIIW